MNGPPRPTVRRARRSTTGRRHYQTGRDSVPGSAATRGCSSAYRMEPSGERHSESSKHPFYSQTELYILYAVLCPRVSSRHATLSLLYVGHEEAGALPGVPLIAAGASFGDHNTTTGRRGLISMPGSVDASDRVRGAEHHGFVRQALWPGYRFTAITTAPVGRMRALTREVYVLAFAFPPRWAPGCQPVTALLHQLAQRDLTVPVRGSLA
jgi:hypothetical protein